MRRRPSPRRGAACMRTRQASLIALAALLCTGEAHAFCRTTTAQIPADYEPDAQGCWTAGLPLYWKNACVSYDIQKDSSRQVSYDDAANSIALAFTRWTSAACPTDGTGSSRASIDVRDL